MKKLSIVVCLLALVTVSTIAFADGFKRIREFLTGFEEVPVVSTEGEGEFSARISRDGSQINYELTYSDLESAVQQAHIHVGQKGVNGGISVWLCSNLASPPTPAGVQPCPTPGGTITGTLTAADVIGPAGQGVAPGEFAELLKLVRAGATYVNVHTASRPAGEIRSQIEESRHH